ncbi:MAG: hypothetical protein NNA21_00230 [Nitrospira sp.]|nr:hypothetical protein [Nitrospira sp.]MCP9460819.1 hypothetical protein [Nitrospira sp.]MCP9475034.1 hypothetical protein [Nitrospira sp.]
MPIENKWKANLEKVAFAKRFPGLLTEWRDCQGKTVEAVTPLTGRQGAAVVSFTDGTFFVVPPLAPEAWELSQALVDARSSLEPKHRSAYEEYDRLAAQDAEALRSARLEKIIGAIQNNVDRIPELKERIKALVQEWK